MSDGPSPAGQYSGADSRAPGRQRGDDDTKLTARFPPNNSRPGAAIMRERLDWECLLTELRKSLQDLFGLDDFRPAQREVIEDVLSGKDVLCVMPTGAGK